MLEWRNILATVRLPEPSRPSRCYCRCYNACHCARGHANRCSAIEVHRTWHHWLHMGPRIC